MSRELSETQKEIEQCERLINDIDKELDREEERHLRCLAQHSHLKSELDKMNLNISKIQKETGDLERECASFKTIFNKVVKTEKLARNLEVVNEIRQEMKNSAMKILQDSVATLDFNYEVQARGGDLATFSQANTGHC